MIASFFYHYGANRNIKIFIGSDDSDTRKEFSELCGQKKVKNFSVNTSAENPASSNTGASIEYGREQPAAHNAGDARAFER